MKEKLIQALSPLGYPVILQGTFPDNESFPESFITFWTNASSEAAAFDNDTALTSWHFLVYFYSTSPLLVATEAQRIRDTLKAAGFIPQGKGRDWPSEEPTHTGWAQEFYILENEGVIL